MPLEYVPALQYRIEPGEPPYKFGNYYAVITEGPTSSERIIAARWFRSRALAEVWAQEEIAGVVHSADSEEVGHRCDWPGEEQNAADLFNATIKPALDTLNLANPKFGQAGRDWAFDEFLNRLKEIGGPSNSEATVVASSIASTLSDDSESSVQRCEQCKVPMDRFGSTLRCRCLFHGIPTHWVETYLGYGLLALFAGGLGWFAIATMGSVAHDWKFWSGVVVASFMTIVGGVSITLHFLTGYEPDEEDAP